MVQFCSVICEKKIVRKGVLNTSTISGVCIVTKKIKYEKYFWHCVVDLNDHSPMKSRCHIFSQSGDIKARTRHLFLGGRV